MSTTISPLMRVAERSELSEAHMTPSADAVATAVTVALYRFDSSGSTRTAVRLAYVDGAASSATPWVANRAKAMLMSTARIVLTPGDVVAAVFTTAWSGTFSMRFRRLPS